MDKSKCLTCEYYFYGRCKKFKVTWDKDLVGCEFYKAIRQEKIIKTVPWEDIAPPPKIPKAQADGDAVSRQAVLDFFDELIGECQVTLSTKGKEHFSCGKAYFDWYVKQLPSVAIPSAEPCESCCNGNQEEKAKLCQKSYLAGMEHKNIWIPVSERLPKPNEYVGNVCRYCLIQNEYGDMMVAKWDGQGWEQMYQYGEYIEDEVIAWMPLPKPYEPQESEEA